MRTRQIRHYVKNFKFNFDYKLVFNDSTLHGQLDRLRVKVTMSARPTSYMKLKYQEVLEMVKYLGFQNFDFIREHEIEEGNNGEDIHIERIYVHSISIISIEDFLSSYRHVNGGDLSYLVSVQIMDNKDHEDDRICVSDDNTDSAVLPNKLDSNCEDYYFEEVD